MTNTAWLLLVVVTVGGGFLAAEDTPWRRFGNHLSTWLLRIPEQIGYRRSALASPSQRVIVIAVTGQSAMLRLWRSQ